MSHIYIMSSGSYSDYTIDTKLLRLPAKLTQADADAFAAYTQTREAWDLAKQYWWDERFGEDPMPQSGRESLLRAWLIAHRGAEEVEATEIWEDRIPKEEP